LIMARSTAAARQQDQRQGAEDQRFFVVHFDRNSFFRRLSYSNGYDNTTGRGASREKELRSGTKL
ncbi:MAG: hypothetical protein K2O11_00605, partial [Oscillospiraceae bacterium]|nr:hypothetical protein [Oscillospiraceae bacterium]